MKRRNQLSTAILLALLAMMFTINGALAHATEDPSFVHQLLDSSWMPALGVVALAAVSVSWWKTRDKQQP